MKKRMLSLLLAMVLVLGTVPVSVFAAENVPFIATVDGEEMTQIEESTLFWADWMTGGTMEVPCYTVTIPEDTWEVTLDFEIEMQWTYYDTMGGYLGEGDTSWSPDTTHTVCVQDSNGDGELDGISVQESYSTDFYILFVYAETEAASCLTVSSNAPAAGEVFQGGLYQLKMSDVFVESDGHEVSYSYTFNSTVDHTFTRLQDGVLYLTPTTQSPDGQPYELVLTAECEGGEVSHTVALTVAPPNEGIEEQYSYEETDKSSVTVYVTVSSDGMPLLAGDTVLANMEITVPYFNLELYGLSGYNRYGTENGRGPYVNDDLIERPTVLHLYIYLLERYYMGLDESQCGTGESGLLDFADETEVFYMDGGVAYSSNGNQALVFSGGATSFFMNQFWGHDCNLMYYRNHCYPYMSPGWGSTADYILLSDGDAIDLAMFTNWAFYHSGYFASFDQDVYNLEEGDQELTVSVRQWGTTAAAEEFLPVNGEEGMSVTLYDSDWNELDVFSFDGDDSNTVTVWVPEEDGVYYLLAMDPSAGDSEVAKAAPAVARIVVGHQGDDVSSYYEDYGFVSIKDDQDRYLVDITPGEIETWSGTLPIHQVTVEEGTEYVCVTFEPGTELSEYYTTYTYEGAFDYPYDTLTVTENEDGTVTVEIPIADYTDQDMGIILQDTGYAWLYGFDFVAGEITEVQVGTAVSRILLNSYKEHLWIGDSVTLSATVLPAEATGWTLEWTSSDETVAVVDQKGKVTGVGDGTAIITAAIEDIQVQCTVTSELFNTAPSVTSGTPDWKQVDSGESVTLDVSGWFTDKEQTNLTYTAQMKKATQYTTSQTYVYNAAGPQVTVNGSAVSFTAPEVGIYVLNVTASDGKLTKTHSCQLTVAVKGAGSFKLCDGIVLTIHNVAPVGHSVDGNTHNVVISKDTFIHNSWIQPHRRAGVTAQAGYSCGQNSAAENRTELQVGAGANMNVHVKDPDGNTETYIVKFYTECSAAHTDGDGNWVCDKCTLEMERPAASIDGQYFATLAEAAAAAQPGQVICLEKNVEEAVTVSGDIIIDLNGKHLSGVTVSRDATLRLADSATDDYEGAYGTACVTGNVESFVTCNGKDYLAVQENGLYSAHRYEVRLTHISLNATQDALGYKARFFGDEIAASHVTALGFRLWINEDRVVTKSLSGKTEARLCLRDILANNGGDTTVYGSAFVTFDVEDKTVTSAAYGTSMKQTLQKVDATWSRYSKAQKDSVIALCDKYYDKIMNWELDNIFPTIDIPI